MGFLSNLFNKSDDNLNEASKVFAKRDSAPKSQTDLKKRYRRRHRRLRPTSIRIPVYSAQMKLRASTHSIKNISTQASKMKYLN